MATIDYGAAKDGSTPEVRGGEDTTLEFSAPTANAKDLIYATEGTDSTGATTVNITQHDANRDPEERGRDWNDVKSLDVSATVAEDDAPGADNPDLVINVDNFVHANIGVTGDGDAAIVVDGAKRGDIETDAGDDSVSIGHSTNGTGWSNHFEITTGTGDDSVEMKPAEGEYYFGGRANGDRAGADGSWQTADIGTGDGNDVVDLSASAVKAVIAGGDDEDKLTGGSNNDVIYGDNDPNTPAGSETQSVNHHLVGDVEDGNGALSVTLQSHALEAKVTLSGFDFGVGLNENVVFTVYDNGKAINFKPHVECKAVSAKQAGAPEDGVAEITVSVKDGQGNPIPFDRIDIQAGANEGPSPIKAEFDVVSVEFTTVESGHDTLDGGAGNDSLYGGHGKDVLTGGSGDDLMDGGTGRDTADYSKDGGTDGVSVDLASGTATDSHGNTDTLIDIENAIGTDQSDTLVGDAGRNKLVGKDGDDLLIGGAGRDKLNGGTGDDTIYGDDVIATDLIVNGGFESYGNLNHGSWGTFANGDGVAGWTTGANEGIEIQAKAHGGTPRDNDGAFAELGTHRENGITDTRTEMSQSVTAPKAGDYELTFDWSARENGGTTAQHSAFTVKLNGEVVGSYTSDKAGWTSETLVVCLKQGENTLTFESDVSAGNQTYGALIDNVSLTDAPQGGRDRINAGAGDDTVYAGGGNDVVNGGAGNDVLNGGYGNDVLKGGQGNDVLNGGAGSDTADFSDVRNKAKQGIEVDLSGGGTTDVDIARGKTNATETDSLTGIENIKGTRYDDMITGGAENNTFKGGGGDDVLDGGAGNDVLKGGRGDNVLIGGAGVDTADFSGAKGDLDIRLDENGNAADVDNGRGGTDQLFGMENLKGGRGDDVLIGNSGANKLSGGKGDDILIGDFKSLDFTNKSLVGEWIDTGVLAFTSPFETTNGITTHKQGIGVHNTTADGGAVGNNQVGYQLNYFPDMPNGTGSEAIQALLNGAETFETAFTGNDSSDFRLVPDSAVIGDDGTVYSAWRIRNNTDEAQTLKLSGGGESTVFEAGANTETWVLGTHSQSLNDDGTQVTGGKPQHKVTLEDGSGAFVDPSALGYSGAVTKQPNANIKEPDLGASETITVNLEGGANAFTFNYARAFEKEGKHGEVGQWTAKDDAGNVIGQGEFGGDDGTKGGNGEVSVAAADLGGQVAHSVEFSALPYGGNDADQATSGRANDSSDYLLAGIEWVPALEGGNDVLSGGKGDDVLIGGGGEDRLLGGRGNDTIVWDDADFWNADGDAVTHTKTNKKGKEVVQSTYDGGKGFDTLDVTAASGDHVIDLTGKKVKGVESLINTAGKDDGKDLTAKISLDEIFRESDSDGKNNKKVDDAFDDQFLAIGLDTLDITGGGSLKTNKKGEVKKDTRWDFEEAETRDASEIDQKILDQLAAAGVTDVSNLTGYVFHRGGKEVIIWTDAALTFDNVNGAGYDDAIA